MPAVSARPAVPWWAPVVLAVASVAGCGDDDVSVADRRAEAAAAAARDGGLGDDVAQFLALAARGSTATYRATYTSDPGGEIEVTNRGTDRRVELVIDGEVAEITVTVEGVTHTCRPTTEGGPVASCVVTDAVTDPPGSFSATALEQFTEALASAVDDYDLAVVDDEIAGVPARCLVATVRAGRSRADLGERGRLCVSDEGVVLATEEADSTLMATAYTTTVADDAFVLPAPEATP